MHLPFRRRRKPAPRHALPVGGPGRKRSDRTTLPLIIILVLTSGFIAGTTATFNASTRNAGNSFTTGALGQPTAPSGQMAGAATSLSWTALNANDPNTPYNKGIGYEVFRKSVGGPLSSAGQTPGCSSGSYASIGYTSTATFSDNNTILDDADKQGEHYCYAIKAVWPCCPTDGKSPVITSLLAPIEQDVQVGYVMSQFSMSGDSDQVLGSGETIQVDFNQPVSVASSITAAQTVCADANNRIIRLGMTSTFANDCLVSTAFEKQHLAFSANPSGTFNLIYRGATATGISAGSGGSDISTNIDTALEALGTIGLGGVVVTRTSANNYDVLFAGVNSGNLPAMTRTNPTGATLTVTTPTNGTADEVYEIQSLTFASSPSGTFTLTHNGAGPTSAITYSTGDMSTDIDTALEALSSVGTGGVVVTKLTNLVYHVRFSAINVGDVAAMTKTNPNVAGTLTIATVQAGAASTASLGYLYSDGEWFDTPARYSISNVTWDPVYCTTPAVSCRRVLITLGPILGTNDFPAIVPAEGWTILPTAANGKTVSATSSLQLCVNNPTTSSLDGLCRPAAPNNW